MLRDVAKAAPERFRTSEQVQDEIKELCAANPERATYHELGYSEQGRLLYAVSLGRGEHRMSLMAGAHSDEPLGPETLRTLLLEGLKDKDFLEGLPDSLKLLVIPHINPDGEARNQSWIQEWPDVASYLRHAFRELPGRDLEFGFPAMRQENKLVSDFLRSEAPLSMHMSLHGMGFSQGAMLLIERHWAFRTQSLRDRFVARVRESGLALHDHNRKGEKGFFYIEPGFTTTPEGEAMGHFFLAQGDRRTASLFQDSSMEFVRSLGGDPLCLVTELPLFVVSDEGGERDGADAYVAFKQQLPKAKLLLGKGEKIQDALGDFSIRPLEINTGIALQLEAIEGGLMTVVSAKQAE